MRTSRTLLTTLALALALSASCKRSDTPPAEKSAEAAKPAAVPAPAASDAVLLAALPAAADMILLVDAQGIARGWPAALLGLTAGGDAADGLWRDFAEILKRRLGVDIAGLRSAAGYVQVAQKAAAVLITGMQADGLGGSPSGDIEGIAIRELDSDLFVAQLGDAVALGTRSGVGALIAVSKGSVQAADKADQAAPLRDTLAKLGTQELRLAVAMDRLPLPPEITEVLPKVVTLGLAGGARGERAGLRLVATGTKEQIAALEARITEERKKVAAEAKGAAEQAKKESIATELGLLVARYGIESLEHNLRIENRGDHLTVDVPMIAMAPATASISAAIAVPAFLKYMRRAKTTEAIDQLDKIYKGAAVYFTMPRVARETGARLPCQFPPTTDWTPAGSPCDHPEDKYPANPDTWTNETWAALSFQINAPHYYRYKFESSGVGAAARFTATATGDLDCDGVWSTFQRIGYADPESTDGECSMTGSSAFYTEQETE